MADNLFSQLDKLGLKTLGGMDLYEKEEEKTSPGNTKGEQEVKVKESDFLVDKTYTCPCCDNQFKAKTVKTGKAKVVGTDSDLRTRYQGVDCLKYGAVVCDKCGYASLANLFGQVMMPAQKKAVREGITETFKGLGEQGETYSYDDAILRHQLALANAVVKKSKVSEKANTCLRLAWLMRGLAESIESGEESPEGKNVEEIREYEKQYLQKAYEGFYAAMQKETFPICGMDEWTYLYLTAELARRAGDMTVCKKLLADILMSKVAAPRIKDKARDLKDSLNF